MSYIIYYDNDRIIYGQFGDYIDALDYAQRHSRGRDFSIAICDEEYLQYMDD